MNPKFTISFLIPNTTCGGNIKSGRSAARLARLLGVQEVGSSNLPAPTLNERPFGACIKGLFHWVTESHKMAEST